MHGDYLSHHEHGDVVSVARVPEPGEGADVVPADQGVDNVDTLDSVYKYYMSVWYHPLMTAVKVPAEKGSALSVAALAAV